VLISDEQDNQLKTLDTAMQHMPMSMDGERLRTYLPYTPCHTPGYYPQVCTKFGHERTCDLA
jgi:hypothetical protein